MPYIPNITGYKPFYIQKDGDAAAIDTAAEWGLVAKSTPYPAMPEPKETYVNDFMDEDGDDEYTAEMHYKSFTFDVEFYVKAYASGASSAADVLRSQIAAFFAHVKEGEFMVYDSYTGLGRRKVRYGNYSEGEGGFKARGNWARLIFTVTFKVNDPVSSVVLRDGKLAVE